MCEVVSILEPAFPGGDAACSACGRLISWLRDRCGEQLILDIRDIIRSGRDCGINPLSIDSVGLVLDLEEAFEFTIPDDAEPLQTLSALIHYFREHGDLLSPD